MTLEQLVEACPHLTCSEDFRVFVRWDAVFDHPRQDWHILEHFSVEQIAVVISGMVDAFPRFR